MDNWFYVNGSQRVGPISEQMLLGLFKNNEISLETYVWKKGFENWERLKNVPELNQEPSDDDFYMTSPAEELSSDFLDEVVAEKVEEEFEQEALESEFIEDEDFDLDFSWKAVEEENEIFYLKTGRDRKEEKQKIYGPYSILELKAAFEDKRINNETLIFGAGMSSWVKAHNSPINELYLEKSNALVELVEKPVLFLLRQGGEEFIGIVKEAKLPHLTLGVSKDVKNLNDSHFVCSLYSGNELKIKKIKVEMLSYNEFTQVAECKVEDLSKEMRELILKYDI